MIEWRRSQFGSVIHLTRKGLPVCKPGGRLDYYPLKGCKVCTKCLDTVQEPERPDIPAGCSITTANAKRPPQGY